MKEKRKNPKKIIFASVAVILAALALCWVNVAVADGFSQKNPIEAPLTANVEKVSVKASPLGISPSKGSVSGQVQISAMSESWCEIEYTENGKIKTGYIKHSAIDNAELTEAQISVAELEIGSESETITVGKTLELTTETIPMNANEAIKWNSSNPDVAEADGGVITAKNAGVAYITASCERVSKTIRICVLPPEDGISFNTAGLELRKGGSANLADALENADGEVKWSTSNGEVAAVSGGKISAKGAGLAIITASLNGQTASCAVSVTPTNTHAKRPLSATNAYGDIYNYHPSVQYFADGWNGYKYWCAFTPYKNNDDQWENPHILASNDLKKWEEPSGFSNPLEPKPSDYEHGSVYNSDTELVYNTDTGELECWWRFYYKPEKEVRLIRKTTSDGVHWSSKEVMLTGEMYVYDFLSPAIIYEDGLYKMWAINQNTGYSIDYRESADGKSWSEIRKIKVEYDDRDLAHWHLDVIRTAKGYEMSISAHYPKENDRVHMSLYYSYSPDNVNYTKATLLFAPLKGTGAWDNMGLYRSSLLFADGKYYLFYSGLNTKTGPSGLGLIGGNTPFSMQDING